MTTQQQWGTPASPETPKKHHRIRNTIIAFGAGLALLIGVSVATSGGGSDTTAPTAGVQQPSSKPVPTADVQKGGGTKDATADVQIGTLSYDEIGLPHATVTITNHSSGTSDYYVEVKVLDNAGTQIDMGNALVTNLEPGKVATQELTITATKDQGPAKLVLSEVQRTASY